MTAAPERGPHGWEPHLIAVLMQLRDYAELGSREYHLKYPGDARNRTQIIDAALTAARPMPREEGS